VRAIWLNQAFLQDVLRPHTHVVLFGTVEARPGLQLLNPEYEVIEADEDEAATIHTGRIVPVYEKAGAMTGKMQRRLVHELLERLPEAIDDPLPLEIRKRLDLFDRRTALIASHFPPAGTPVELLNRFRTPAQVRLIFDEFFLFQVGMQMKRRVVVSERKPVVIAVDDRIRESVCWVLSFRLTGG